MPVSLYVGNLPYSTNENQLRELFARAGTVEEVRLPTDRVTGQPRGFGFVEMATADEAQSAIAMFNGFDLDNRQLRVSLAEERAPRTGRSGGRGGGGYGGGYGR